MTTCEAHKHEFRIYWRSSDNVFIPRVNVHGLTVVSRVEEESTRRQDPGPHGPRVRSTATKLHREVS